MADRFRHGWPASDLNQLTQRSTLEEIMPITSLSITQSSDLSSPSRRKTCSGMFMMT
ncbi:hypothetical protein KSP40_PGU000832 [Platanthera guangdongensis]|uniref:Uncharacterized protein n=1 Tax=Platanthera guangdongensis TaxID=2320717 RepID=A0ABR2LEC1_9ASPA